MVCRSLSFGKPLNLSRKAFNITGKQWLNQVSCKGDENSLLTCDIKDAVQPNCSTQDYIYMKCGLKGKIKNKKTSSRKNVVIIIIIIIEIFHHSYKNIIYKSVENLLTLGHYIFFILQYFASKLFRFTKYRILFQAVVKYLPRWKFLNISSYR